MWWTSTHIKGNLGHREGHDLAHQCQRGEITADNPQGYWQGCSSSSLWSLAAAAKKSGHKDGRSKAKEGLLPNMGPEQSEKLYTPPRAQRCSPTICRPAASPKREVSPRSGEGELGTPPPRPSQFSSLSLWLALLSEAPFSLHRVLPCWAMLWKAKPAHGASPQPGAYMPPREPPLEATEREWKPHGVDEIHQKKLFRASGELCWERTAARRDSSPTDAL